MRTTTKILFCLLLAVASFTFGRCSPIYSSVAYAKPQPPARTPMPQYQPGLDSAVFIEMKQGHCTAVIFEDNYHLLTATHCVEDFNDIQYTTTHKGARIANKGRIVANDARDHVVLKMERPLVGRPAKIVPTPPPGSPVYVWGNPGVFRFLHRQGYVAGSFVSDEGTYYDVIAIDIWHGDSGGAIFDARGNIVNVNHVYYNDYNPRARSTFRMAMVQPFDRPIVK